MKRLSVALLNRQSSFSGQCTEGLRLKQGLLRRTTSSVRKDQS